MTPLRPLFITAMIVGCTPAPSNAPTVIAHRGASAYLPEHTLIAWERAVELGADYIEQDLQLTADGVLVVLHDGTLDRTARGPSEDCAGPVSDKTLAQLKRCEVSSWKIDQLRAAGESERADALLALPVQRIQTLEEIFQRFGTDGSVRYYIETKQPGPGDSFVTEGAMEVELLSLLNQYDLIPTSTDDRTVLIQSFSPESLRRMRAVNSDLPLVQLIGGDGITEGPLDAAMQRIADYAVGVGPSWRLVTREFVQAAHGADLVVHPYTVNDEERMRSLIELGVNGMFTDLPGTLISLGRAR